MSLRLRWYRLEAEGGTSPRALGALLARELFSARRPKGFVLDESKIDRVVARYVERREVVDHFVDPLGREHNFPHVVFRQVKFRYQTEAPQLELIDSPRELAPFVARLMQLYEGRVTVHPVEIDLRRCLTALEALVGKIVVRSMEVGGFLIAEDVFARVAFTGPRDIRELASEFLSGREAPIARARVAWSVDGQWVDCTLTPGGAKLENDMASIVRPKLRAAVRAVMKSMEATSR